MDKDRKSAEQGADAHASEFDIGTHGSASKEFECERDIGRRPVHVVNGLGPEIGRDEEAVELDEEHIQQVERIPQYRHDLHRSTALVTLPG